MGCFEARASRINSRINSMMAGELNRVETLLTAFCLTQRNSDPKLLAQRYLNK